MMGSMCLFTFRMTGVLKVLKGFIVDTLPIYQYPAPGQWDSAAQAAEVALVNGK